MAQPDPGNITRLLNAWSGGEKGALEELVPYVYGELRGLAAAYLRRERPDHTLQPTALVHEAYLRLIDQTHIEIDSRAHFFAIAARLIREILVNHARRHNAAKRGHVELRFFGGLTEEEIAGVLGVSPITVKREWRTARAMLHTELCGVGVD